MSILTRAILQVEVLDRSFVQGISNFLVGTPSIQRHLIGRRGLFSSRSLFWVSEPLRSSEEARRWNPPTPVIRTDVPVTIGSVGFIRWRAPLLDVNVGSCGGLQSVTRCLPDLLEEGDTGEETS